MPPRHTDPTRDQQLLLHQLNRNLPETAPAANIGLTGRPRAHPGRHLVVPTFALVDRKSMTYEREMAELSKSGTPHRRRELLQTLAWLIVIELTGENAAREKGTQED